MKRIRTTIGWFTAFLCVTLLWGSPAMAENYGLYIAGTQVTDANCNALGDIDDVAVAPGGEFKYDPAAKTLTMKDVTVSVGDAKKAIMNSAIEGLTIEVSGTNSLKTTDGMGLHCIVSTTIKGNGSLTVASSIHAAVFVASTTLTISNITLEATGNWGFAGMDGNQNETLIIKNATVTAKGTTAAIADLNTFTLEGCQIIAPAGAEWKDEKHAVVNADGSKAKEVKIEPVVVYELNIAGTLVTSLNCNALGDIDGVTVAEGGEFKYDPATKTLTMKDVTVSVGDGKDAIKNSGIEGLTIEVSGTNSLKGNSGLSCLASTVIEGNGSLTTIGSTVSVDVGSAPLTISDITLDATGKWGIAGDDGNQNETLIIKNATVTAKGTTAAICDLKTFTLEGCDIIAPAGAEWKDDQHAVVDVEGNKVKEVRIEPELYIAGKLVTSLNCNAVKDIQGVTVAEGGEFKYDPATKTLTMKGVTVSVESGDAIRNNGIEGLKIEVSGTNSLKTTDETGLTCYASTTIKGNGSLTAIGGTVGVYVRSTTLTISDITLDATGQWGIVGENDNDGLIIKNATVTAKGTEVAIADLKTFTLEGCQIIAPAGAEWKAEKHAVVDAEGNPVKEVRIGKEAVVAVTGVKVTPTTVDLKVNGTQQLTITVEPATATNKNYTCKSDKESVATVDNTGLVTAVGVGTATITITTEDGGKTITCTVNVTEGGSSTFTLTPATLAELPAAGGSPSVTVTSDKAWSLTIPAAATWVTPSITSGTGTAAVVFTVTQNVTTAARSTTVTFTQAETNATRTLNVTQAAAAPVHVPLTGLSFVESAVTIKVGTEATLALNFEPANATNKNVTWAVTEGSDKLTVDANGKITASATAGTAKVTATSEENTTIKNECTVTITIEDVPVASLTLSSSSLNLTVGGTEQLWATVKPSTATHKTVTWTVTDGTEVVSVSATGVVTALKAGTATVTATAGGKTATCGVTVTEAPISTFTLDPTTLAELPAAGGSPSVTVNSDKAWSLTIPAEATWVSASTTSGTGTEAVTFTVTRNETAAARSATVTFTQAETNVTLTLEVKQAAGEAIVPLTGLSINPKELPIKVGTSAKLRLEFTPANATNKNVTWAVTEGAASLEVDQDGKITATQVAGTAKVTVTSVENPTVTATCTVTVTTEDVPVESLTISSSSLTLTVGATNQLSVTVKPQTATNKTPQWSTSSAEIATVNASGLVTAVAVGTATITASIGSKTATCTVTVNAPPTAVEDALLAGVVVAPNPFSAQLRILNPEGVSIAYELVNLAGVVLRAGVVAGVETTVDTADLSAGLYFVRLTGENGASRTVRVVKY